MNNAYSPRSPLWFVVAVALIIAGALATAQFLVDHETPTSDPATTDQWVWIGHHGVQLKVPASWQFDTSDPCQPQLHADAPNVRLGPAGGMKILMGCIPGAGGPPAAAPATLTFESADSTAVPAWDRFPSALAGDKRVRVFWGADFESDHPTVADLAAQIIASASAIQGVDQNGCPSVAATSLQGSLSDLRSATRVAICQYQYSGSGMDLWSSRELTGAAAQKFTDELRMLGSRPVDTGGPSCVDSAVSARVMLHLLTPVGEQVVRVNYLDCTGTGAVTGAGNHGMTESLCQKIFVGPTSSDGITEPMARRCGMTSPG